ncbi:MAG: transglycosylase family protein [Solirubrobacterales bacterium]
MAATVLLAILLAVGAVAQAQDGLRAKVDRGREEAASLGAEIRALQERVSGAEVEAASAAARERRLSRLLAAGRERAAGLASEVAATEARLAAERRRLRRARRALAGRLVAIYTSGAPSAASVVLASGDLDELIVRTEYLEQIERSDAELAGRVEEVRDAVRHDLVLVAELKRRVDAHNERLAAAREEIGAVRAAAEAAAAELDSLSAARSAALATLKAKIEQWVEEIEAAEAASRAAAEETVGRWLGGPYSIPTYIVICESGGNYGALNPSSGAGGAYQIIPSTWEAYGGQGAPHEAPKAEQDRIAAEIWADSGGSAWVCA